MECSFLTCLTVVATSDDPVIWMKKLSCCSVIGRDGPVKFDIAAEKDHHHIKASASVLGPCPPPYSIPDLLKALIRTIVAAPLGQYGLPRLKWLRKGAWIGMSDREIHSFC